MGTSSLRAQLHLFGYHAGTPSRLSRGNGSRLGIAWWVIRALAATWSGADAQPPPSRAEQVTGIDRPIDIWARPRRFALRHDRRTGSNLN